MEEVKVGCKEQLCWYCTKTNEIDCSWFSNRLKLPKGAERDSLGYITSCPDFEYSGVKTLNRGQDYDEAIRRVTAKYNISTRTIFRYKEKYGNDWEEKLAANEEIKKARKRLAEEREAKKKVKQVTINPETHTTTIRLQRRGRNTMDPAEAVKAELPLHLKYQIKSIRDIYIILSMYKWMKQNVYVTFNKKKYYSAMQEKDLVALLQLEEEKKVYNTRPKNRLDTDKKPKN